jgi:hypothetical protein
MQFNEPTYGSAPLATGPETVGGIRGLVIKWGLAQDAGQAQKILIVVLGVVVLATIGLFFFGGVSGPARPPVPNIDGTPRTTP